MNQAVNFFWTILSFIPVIVFWAVSGNMMWCYVFSGFSLLGLIVPLKWLQLSDDPKFYQKLGIRLVKKFVQNGDYANRLARRSNPGHRIIKSKTSAAQYAKITVMYERYHLFCFVFFLATAVLAAIKQHYTLLIFIILANVIYNVYPMLLQQYNRARLLRLSPNKVNDLR